MPPLWRISDRTTFAELRRRGRRVRRGPVTVTWLPGQPGSAPRVAFAVGRATGSAVARNRLRRRLRAILREAPELAPGAYLVAAGPDAADLPAAELRTVLESAVGDVSRSEVEAR